LGSRPRLPGRRKKNTKWEMQRERTEKAPPKAERGVRKKRALDLGTVGVRRDRDAAVLGRMGRKPKLVKTSATGADRKEAFSG